jgi:hypothetical protein
VPKIENVERRIRRIEGFRVRFLYEKDRKDVRGDKIVSRGYPYEHAASNDITVEAWKNTRFRRVYPGYEIDVLDGGKSSVQGNTKLATVRHSYQQ